jgi:hypothetical protein
MKHFPWLNKVLSTWRCFPITAMASPHNVYRQLPAVEKLVPIPLRAIMPLSEPSPSEPPALPSPARQPFFSGGYELSTYLVPSAHPRSTPDVSCPAPPPASGPDRRVAIVQIAAELLSNSILHAQGRLSGEKSTKQLWNCINCYRRRGLQQNNAHGLTLFFAHAISFPKEVRTHFMIWLGIVLISTADLGAYVEAPHR